MKGTTAFENTTLYSQSTCSHLRFHQGFSHTIPPTRNTADPYDTTTELSPINKTINESYVIFRKFDMVEDYILINHILLLAKYYIYCRKCHNSVPSITGFIARARRVFDIELDIAREKSKLLFHFQKWKKLPNALNSS